MQPPPPIEVHEVLGGLELVDRTLVELGPYGAVGRYFRASAMGLDDPRVPPHFRDDWALHGVAVPGAQALFDAPQWRDVAARYWGCDVVEPQSLFVNLMLAQDAPLVAHTDVPVFRGVDRTFPMWLLYAMHRSGRFERWRPRTANVLWWRWAGDGGGLTYWPDGPSRPWRRVEPPMTDRAIVADLHRIWHRVEPIGGASAVGGLVPLDSELSVDAASLDDVRVSLVWKAFCYESADEREELARDPVTLADAVDIIGDDLRERGVDHSITVETVFDITSRDVLQAAYPAEHVEP
ncbi:MAG: hypothetical protein KDB21_01090 [Acidimicrobiales bacterium]|nr:hypothetical protein [Acidimicrobiales bacterium]